KQNAFAGGRYVLVGEFLCLFWFGACLSVLARVGRPPLLAALAVSAMCLYTAFEFNYTRFIAAMERDLRIARRSTFDVIEETVRKLPLEAGETILVNSSKSLPTADLPVIHPDPLTPEAIGLNRARYLVLDRPMPAGSPPCASLVSRFLGE